MDDDRCCPGDFGGSHYHCPYCGCTCSMMGHMNTRGELVYCPPVAERPAYAADFVDPEAVADHERRQAERAKELPS